MIKIVISDYFYPNLNNEYRVLAQLGPDVEILDCTKLVPGGIKEPDALIPYVRDADALIVHFCKINRDVINAMTKCKVIARYAIGVDTIDVPAAIEKGIYIANVPDYCISEVADAAIALMLNAVRKISFSRDMLLNGSYNLNAIKPMTRTENLTLALLGFGNIARNVCKKMQPFFGKIISYDPYFSNKADYPQVNFLSLDETLSCADVISIHIPLNPHTKCMLSTAQFARMKDGVILINTSRGGVIDEAAMLEALNSGKLGYCGLDVLTTEEFDDSPFLHHEHVMLTPHIAWYSEEANTELQTKVAENVVSTLLHGKPIYSVSA